MKTPIFFSSVPSAVVFCLLLGWSHPPAFGSQQNAQQTTEGILHQQQAAQRRQRVEQLEQVIQHYQIMEKVYTVGSRGISPGFNPTGRRDMVERVKRAIQYFTRKEHELEQQAAAEERPAQYVQRP
jgi:hypothetical protein